MPRDTGKSGGSRTSRCHFPWFWHAGYEAPCRACCAFFDASGHHPLPLDDQQGGGPSLTFQVATGGDFYIRRQQRQQRQLQPIVGRQRRSREQYAVYTLGCATLMPKTPLLPDLTGSSFRTGAGHSRGRTSRSRSATPCRTGAGPIQAIFRFRCRRLRAVLSIVPLGC